MKEYSPICALGGGGGGLLPQAKEFRGIWGVLVLGGLPPSLPGPRARDIGFPKRISNSRVSGLPWCNVQCL